MFHAIGAPESALAGFREGQAGGQAGRDAAVAWWVLSQVQWLLLFAAVPATAAALCRAFARDDPNFAEMWVFALYVAGQSLLLGAVWMLLEHWTAWGGFVLLLAATPPALFVAACVGYFGGARLSRLLRSLVAVVLAALVTIAFVVAAIFVATAMGRVLG